MVDSRVPFTIRQSDAHAVSSALAAAERSWKRGENAAVVRWLLRAAEAASEAADGARALELEDCARRLAPPVPPPVPQPRARNQRPEVPASPSSSVHLLTKLAPQRDGPPSALAGEVSRGRVVAFEEDTNQVAIFQLRGEAVRKKEPGPPPVPAKPKRGVATEAPTRAHSRDEWAVETVAAAEASAEEYQPPSELETRAGLPLTKPPVRATEAVRVLLWRDEEGALYVTTVGAPAPPHAVEAMLTALSPDSDLVSLLEDPV